MLDQAAPVSAIAHLISLAIAPVFLLAGIGSILNVLAGRLARSVDRWRRLEDQYEGLEGEALAEAMRELHILDRRMTVINLAIGCCTGSALFICLVVAILFVADLADFPVRPADRLFVHRRDASSGLRPDPVPLRGAAGDALAPSPPRHHAAPARLKPGQRRVPVNRRSIERIFSDPLRVAPSSRPLIV
jgi:hypothetical protein